jgi:hypothetical protein
MIHFIVWYLSIGVAGAMWMWFFGFVLERIETLILMVAWPYFVVAALIEEARG